LSELKTVPSHLGIEFDVRESAEGPLVTHDPWTNGVRLREFLAECDHAFYIVNIKSEGIEFDVLDLLKTHGIENFFLLDCSFPMIVRIARQGERRLAIRVSEYESIGTAYAMAGVVDWVWVDVFTRIPVSPQDCRGLKAAGFKLCFVSPELQRRPEDLIPYREAIADCMNMVCTKVPTAWSSDEPPQASTEYPPRPSRPVLSHIPLPPRSTTAELPESKGTSPSMDP
jgi:hypothetical protein